MTPEHQIELTRPKGESVTRTVKNGDGRLPEKERNFLTYSNALLVPCGLDQQPSEYTLTFQADGLQPFSNVRREDKLDQYRLLINCAQLDALSGEYIFSMDPENLMYDINLIPHILLRDAALGQSDNFVKKYKALIACVLCPRYQYQNFFEGGDDLFSKQKQLRPLVSMNSTEELRTYLETQYEKKYTAQKTTKKLVNKRNIIAARIIIPLLAVALAAAGYFCWRAYFQQIPFDRARVQAYNDYLAKDYVSVADDLQDYSVEQLPLESRYILANSYVSVEGLTDEQKTHVLSTLTLKTEDAVINFWIEVGRGNYSSAEDYAKQLNDNELLLFALIKEDVAVQNDSALSGADKSSQLKNIEDQIKTLQESLGEAATNTATGDTTGNATAVAGDAAASSGATASDTDRR